MDTYNVNKYTNEELYEILDMNNPTDRELEAKIIQMLNKYENITTDVGKNLYTFFDNIYKRFFTTDSDDEIEGFTNNTPEATKGPKAPEAPEATKEGDYKPQNISSVQQFDYSQDKLQLNPLLKQTIKRVISIDSQYRNISTYPNTTSFSFDLSEPLRDVVSLKLYSVQIPYTWYTVAKSYGSNFFYLRGNSPGITYEAYNYKIEIKPGNYDQTTLPAALNQAFQDLSNNAASDVNFNGVQLVNYNSVTAKTTIQLNIQNTFNETYYNIKFPYFTYPIELTNTTNTTNTTKSIPSFLGFNQSSYTINSISSRQTYIKTPIINSQLSLDYVLDNSNNYFTVIQYKPYDQFSGYDTNSTILETIKVQLKYNGLPYIGQVNRNNIMSSLNQSITTSGYFDSSSKIEIVHIIDISNENYGYSYFKLSLSLNRYVFKYIPNSKIALIFPNETPIQNPYGENFTIWQYQPNINYSCFFFDNTLNEFSKLISESPSIQSTFTVDTSTNIIMTCTSTGYNTSSLNDFNMNVQTGVYTVNGFLNAINTSFSNKNINSNTYFNMTNTQALLDNSDYFNLNIDLTKAFINKNYAAKIDGNSFLTKPKTITSNFSRSYSIVGSSSNLLDINYINITIQRLNSGYILDTSCILIIRPDTTYGNDGNKDANSLSVSLASQSNNNLLRYPTYQTFLSAIQNAFITTSVTSIVNTQLPLTKTTISYNDSYSDHIDISLNLNYYYYLTEADYDISFVDYTYDISLTSNIWSKFNLNSKYDLHTGTTTGIAIIKGNKPVSSTILGSITLYDNSNNIITFNTTNSNVPTDIITIYVEPGTYTTGPLITAINKALIENYKTYGSYFQIISKNQQSYAQIWTNINRNYTTQDYILDFYDPINFVSCFAGSTSIQSTTWDSTIGWVLGFRDYTQYFLIPQNQTKNTANTGNPYYYKTSTSSSFIITQLIDASSNLLTNTNVSITGDTSLSTNLYNYFLISLDDFIQNHLNDGLVTITRTQTAIEIADYTYSSTQTCDPVTNQLITTSTPQNDSNNVTNTQLYSVNQSMISKQNPSKEYSPGPFIKDLFGIIPIKPPAKTGDYYTEFGGTLQNQERVYFGPVNIRKMTIQLLTDRGTVIDLNNSNWSFSFVCEQLYRASSS